MVFYLSGLQNIEYSVYEAAKIDGASPMQSFFKITVPLLKPTILLTAITSTNGAGWVAQFFKITLPIIKPQVALAMIMSVTGSVLAFEQFSIMTKGGPSQLTTTSVHYIYNTSFVQSPNFGYAAAMSILILIMVAILAILQMKVGDER